MGGCRASPHKKQGHSAFCRRADHCTRPGSQKPLKACSIQPSSYQAGAVTGPTKNLAIRHSAVVLGADTVPPRRPKNSKIGPNSAFLLTGRCGDPPYEKPRDQPLSRRARYPINRSTNQRINQSTSNENPPAPPTPRSRSDPARSGTGQRAHPGSSRLR